MKVLYFGSRENFLPGTKTCGISQDPNRDASQYESYLELKKFLEGTDIKDQISLDFVDIKADDMSPYEKVSDLLKEYASPIISIGDKDFIVGKSHNVNIFMKIKENLK